MTETTAAANPIRHDNRLAAGANLAVAFGRPVEKPPAVSFRVRFEPLGGHVHVGLWSSEFGPDTAHGRNGTLVFRPVEWEAFARILDDAGVELAEVTGLLA